MADEARPEVLTKVPRSLKVNVSSLLSPKTIFITPGLKVIFLMESQAQWVIDIKQVGQTTVDLSKLKTTKLNLTVGGVRLAWYRTLWDPFPRRVWYWLDIPSKLIFSVTPGLIAVWGAGAVEIRPRHYVVAPGFMGRALLLNEATLEIDLDRLEHTASMIFEIQRAIEELTRRSVRLSIPVNVIREARAIPERIPVSEGDLEEFLREQIAKLRREGR